MRIIPVMMVTAALFMTLKLVDISRGTQALSGALAETQPKESPVSSTPPAKAEEAKKEEPKKEESKKEEPKKEPAKEEGKKEEPKKEEAKKDEGKKEGGEKTAEKKEEPKKEESKKEEGKKEEGKKEGKEGKEEKKNPNVSDQPGDVLGRHFSSVELDLLQNLAKRREDLNRWEQNIQIKEATLDATQKRIDERIQQIEDMKKEVSALLAQFNEKEDTKIKSLVKIYESMKPKEAARIFDELEMPVLLMVIDKMAEKKAAPILAEMDPKKAKQVTVELAERRKVNTMKMPPPAAVPATGAAK